MPVIHSEALMNPTQCPMAYRYGNGSEVFCLFGRGHAGPHGQDTGLVPRWTDLGDFYQLNRCGDLSPETGWQCEQYNVVHEHHYAWGPSGRGIHRWTGAYAPPAVQEWARQYVAAGLPQPRTYAQRKRGRHAHGPA